MDPLTALPSPSASAEDNVLDYWASSDVSSMDPKPSTPSPANRKRRLSDADAQGPPKRPRGVAVGSRLHAVSDPLPMSSAIVQASELLNLNDFGFDFENFDFPSTEPLDPSVPLDIEVFDWTSVLAFGNCSTSPNTSCKSTAIELPFIINVLLSSVTSPIAAQQVDLSASELFSSTTPVFDISGSTGSEFDFLHMLSQPTPSQVVGSSANFATSISQASSLMPMAPLESVGVAGTDWSAYVEPAPSAHYPTPIVSSQPYGFIDISATPNFEPSVSKPPSPPSPADIIAQSESAAAKQSKLEHFYAHLEAAMKLQQEITTGDD